MKPFVCYEVEYFESILNKCFDQGYFQADTYAEAMGLLCEYYGENNIYSVKIKFMNDGGPLIITPNLKLADQIEVCFDANC